MGATQAGGEIAVPVYLVQNHTRSATFAKTRAGNFYTAQGVQFSYSASSLATASSCRVSEEMILIAEGEDFIDEMLLQADLSVGRLCPFWWDKAPLVCAATKT